jgi:hypothetical protein
MQEKQGRSSSAFAFAALLFLCIAYAYLESRAFGHEVAIPMYGYIVAALAAFANLMLSRFSAELYHHNLRLIGNAVLAQGVVIAAVSLQKYSAYHAIEFILLAIWLGSLKSVRLMFTFSINALTAILFIVAMYGGSGYPWLRCCWARPCCWAHISAI